MNINTKFNIGDSLFCIGYNRTVEREICNACGGVGKITLFDDDKIMCPKCCGRGYNDFYSKRYWQILNNNPSDFDYNKPVDKINITIEANKTKPKIKITYNLKNSCVLYNEKDCFSDIEEAQQECDKRNNELKESD